MVGSRFWVHELWFMVQGSRIMVHGSRFTNYGSWFKVHELWFMVLAKASE
jgi:hypothetical protein